MAPKVSVPHQPPEGSPCDLSVAVPAARCALTNAIRAGFTHPRSGCRHHRDDHAARSPPSPDSA
ncbi:hypothetical protein GCM10023321_83950 [Pseudonocardia eucalypti]|uniref:Uncharacterized protein n=1 Tax=Pseudonocardia eucalypti TaxID=648755 RepID=A0ABP9REX1_9PSEU